MRTFRLFRIYISQYLLSWIVGWNFLVTLTINQLIPPLIGMALWVTVGLNQSNVASYFLALIAVRILTMSGENHTFSDRVYNGEFSSYLLRPHAIYISTLSENLAIRLCNALFAFPVIVVLTLWLNTQFELTHILLSLPALVLAALTRFLFTYLLALCAFWTQKAHGIVVMGEVFIFLLGGEAVPFIFVPDYLKTLFVLSPFRYMLGFPAEISSGFLQFEATAVGYIIQVAWSLILLMAVRLTLSRGIKRYTSVGG